MIINIFLYQISFSSSFFRLANKDSIILLFIFEVSFAVEVKMRRLLFENSTVPSSQKIFYIFTFNNYEAWPKESN